MANKKFFLASGLLAEFETPEKMLEAASALRDRGVRRMDTYSPYPVHGVEESMGLPKSPVSKIVLVAGIAGAVFAYWIQWLTNAFIYPLNVGGRPAHAAPAFLLITFETMVLFGGFAALFSVIGLSRLPRYWDPLFEVKEFESASIDRFWVGVDSRDPNYEPEELAKLWRELGALQVLSFGEGAGVSRDPMPPPSPSSPPTPPSPTTPPTPPFQGGGGPLPEGGGGVA